jgi:hypothetical protein
MHVEPSTRDKILERGLDLLGEVGLTRVTLGMLADDVGRMMRSRNVANVLGKSAAGPSEKA